MFAPAAAHNPARALRQVLVFGSGRKSPQARPPLTQPARTDLAFRIAESTQTAPECISERVRRRRRHQHTNIGHFSRLLCARRERPRDRRAAKERDQLAPPQLSYLVGFAYPERRDAGRKKVSGSVPRARRRFCPDLPWYAYGDRAPCSSEKGSTIQSLGSDLFCHTL
jgi:hypothetical protein